MKNLLTSAPIQPKKLSKTDRDALVEELYQVHAQIFDGVDKESFRNYVIEPDTYLTKLFLFRSQAGELVGYMTFQVFQAVMDRKGKEKTAYVYRTETGILKDFRGKAPIDWLLFSECLKFSAKKGFPEAYFMATPISPVPFCLADRNIATLYPRPNQETPDHIISLKNQLSHALNIPSASSENPFVKQVGWKVRMNEMQVRRLKNSNKPAIQYYLQQNPSFLSGTGMMMVAPANIQNAIGSGWKILSRKLGRFLQTKKYKVSHQLSFIGLSIMK